MSSALRQAVRERLIARGEAVDRASVTAAVRSEGRILDERVLAGLVDSLLSEMQGAGALEPFLSDPAVTDVLLNGHSQLWLDRGAGLVEVPSPLGDEPAARALAVRLAARAGRRLDDASPYVDARLPTGERLHAIIPPVAVGGTTISLRIPSRRRFTLEQLISSSFVDAPGARWLRALIRSRAAFLVTGGTGSGKTTVLGVLLGLVSPRERIVIAEDTTELRPAHPHVVQLESRPPNLEGSGSVSLQVLVRQALRMRPDRLVVGEVRGAEVVDLLGALNTGHEGGCGTVHANSAVDVPARLEALALAAGLPGAGARAQIRAGLDFVLHVSRPPDGPRQLSEIAVVGGRGDSLEVGTALRRESSGGMVPGENFARLQERVGPWLE